MRDVFNSLDIGWGLCRTFPREMLKRISDEIKEVFYDREAGAQVRIFFYFSYIFLYFFEVLYDLEAGAQVRICF